MVAIQFGTGIKNKEKKALGSQMAGSEVMGK